MKQMTIAQMRQELKEKINRMRIFDVPDETAREAVGKLSEAENWYAKALERTRWAQIRFSYDYFNSRAREFWQIVTEVKA